MWKSGFFRNFLVLVIERLTFKCCPSQYLASPRFYCNLLWIHCYEYNENLLKNKSLRRVVVDSHGISTLAFLDENIISQILLFGACKLLREQTSKRELAEWHIHFAVWIFVFELALSCSSKIQLITDVCNHFFWCPFKEQSYILICSGVCSEPLLFLNWLFDCWTFVRHFIEEIWNTFWCEFATDWLFQKILLLANAKVTSYCCVYAVRTRPRKQYLISIMFGCLTWNFFQSTWWNRSFFSESFLV